MRMSAALLGLLVACTAATEVAKPTRVTFIGDSIVAEFGSLEGHFGAEARLWTNAGVPGDTAAGVRVRIERDVPATSDACLLLVGINDIWGGAGDGGAIEDLVPPGTVENGFRSVGGELELAVQNLKARGITPVLSTLLPVSEDYPHAAIFNPKIQQFNAWIRKYAADNAIALVDYHADFVRPDGTTATELLLDGLHPNDDGMAIMVATTQRALHRAGVLH